MTNIMITVPADFKNEDDIVKFANIVQAAVDDLIKHVSAKKNGFLYFTAAADEAAQETYENELNN